ncbi:hypothetical protein ACF05L_09885 [Streptomyces bobili]|uniref:rhamnogalacturonan endolyase family protein n=1 Tax=Streptomyces bobili TaxID=67280 RepID=UPI0036FBA73A
MVAVPSAEGTFLSRRLLGTEYARHGEATAFHVYKNGRRLNREPVGRSTTYRDDTPGNGRYTVRAVVDGREAKASSRPRLRRRVRRDPPLRRRRLHRPARLARRPRRRWTLRTRRQRGVIPALAKSLGVAYLTDRQPLPTVA